MFTLPKDTIVEGVHVGLDVRGCRLRIAKARHDPLAVAVVEVIEYELRDTNVALLFFEYLERYRERFGSVKIT
jgi:hypothetical protein